MSYSKNTDLKLMTNNLWQELTVENTYFWVWKWGVYAEIISIVIERIINLGYSKARDIKYLGCYVYIYLYIYTCFFQYSIVQNFGLGEFSQFSYLFSFKYT